MVTGERMKEIIVTGGEGFIGSHLVERLVNEGYFVKVIDDERVGKYKITHANVLYINEDVANYKTVERDKKAVGIFHLANSPRVRRSLDYPVDTMRNNIDSTLNVIQMALDIDCPLYFSTSSSTKYAESNNPYTLSKKMCEDTLNIFKEKYGIKATLMYYYNVFGPGEADYGEYSTVIRRFKQKIESGTPMVIFGDGSKTRAFTHVLDVVQGMIELLDESPIPDEVHFGNPKSVSILEIAHAFVDMRRLEGSKCKPFTQYTYDFEDDVEGEAQDTRCETPTIDCKYDVIEYINDWTIRHEQGK